MRYFSPRKVIEIALTTGLFTISAVLSIRLFWELAGGDRVAAVLLATVALLFEGSKVALWFWGIKRRAVGAILLTLILVGLSLFASFASALAILQSASRGSEINRSQSERATAALDQAQKEIAALTAARDALPPDYITARARYEELLKPLRDRAEAATREIAATETALSPKETTSELFDAVARAFTSAANAHTLALKLRMLYMMIVASCLEVVAMTIAFYEVTDTGARSESTVWVLLGNIAHLKRASKTACGKSLTNEEPLATEGAVCPVCAVVAARLKISEKILRNKSV